MHVDQSNVEGLRIHDSLQNFNIRCNIEISELTFWVD